MGKDEDRSYPSPRVLGMMYRLIEPAPEYRPFEDICIDTRLTSRIVPQVYLKEAGSMKQYVCYHHVSVVLSFSSHS